MILTLAERASSILDVPSYQMKEFAERTGIGYKVQGRKRFFWAFSDEDMVWAKKFFALKEKGFSPMGASILIKDEFKKEVENG